MMDDAPTSTLDVLKHIEEKNALRNGCPQWSPELYFRRAMQASEAIPTVLGRLTGRIGADGRLDQDVRADFAPHVYEALGERRDESIPTREWQAIVERWGHPEFTHWPGRADEDDRKWAKRQLMAAQCLDGQSDSLCLLAEVAQVTDNLAWVLAGRSRDDELNARVYRAARVIACYCRELPEDDRLDDPASDLGRVVDVAGFHQWLDAPLPEAEHRWNDVVRRLATADLADENPVLAYVLRAWVDIFVDGWRPTGRPRPGRKATASKYVFERYVEAYPPSFKRSKSLSDSMFRLFNAGPGGKGEQRKLD